MAETAANPQPTQSLPAQAHQSTCACGAHQLTITIALGKAVAAKRAALSAAKELETLIADLRQVQKTTQA